MLWGTADFGRRNKWSKVLVKKLNCQTKSNYQTQQENSILLALKIHALFNQKETKKCL